MRIARLTIGLALLLAASYFGWRGLASADLTSNAGNPASTQDVTGEPAPTAPPSRPAPVAQVDTIRSAATTPNEQDLPASLAGSETDGAVELDAQGQLSYTKSLRHLFDQVLSTVGELDLTQIRALLIQRLDALTTPDGKRQALAAFERYLRYLQSVDAAAASLSALPLDERLDALVALRRQLLGETMADAFFADDEAYQRYTLATQELARETTLGAAERSARERELIAQLPPAIREPLLAQQRVDSDLADASNIDAQTSDEQQRYARRRERFGDEAAARMELLDRERAAWDQRVQRYRAEQARLAGSTANVAARQASLDAWLQAHFSEAEQRRIRSLEAIGGL